MRTPSSHRLPAFDLRLLMLSVVGLLLCHGTSAAGPLTVFPAYNGNFIVGQSFVDGGALNDVTLPPLGLARPALAPGATFFGTLTFNDATDSILWSPWRIESGAAGASTNGQYILLAAATYKAPLVVPGLTDIEAIVGGSATAPAGGFIGGEYISFAAFLTNAHMSAPAISTWLLASSEIGDAGPTPIFQNASPFQIPAAVYNAGQTGLIGLYVSFRMGPNEVFGIPGVPGVNACPPPAPPGGCIDPAPEADPGPAPLPQIPEPSTAALVLSGLLALAFAKRKLIG